MSTEPSTRTEDDKPLIDPPPYPNDWFEWVTLIVAGTGIVGGAWALFYLAKLNGAI